MRTTDFSTLLTRKWPSYLNAQALILDEIEEKVATWSEADLDKLWELMKENCKGYAPQWGELKKLWDVKAREVSRDITGYILRCKYCKTFRKDGPGGRCNCCKQFRGYEIIETHKDPYDLNRSEYGTPAGNIHFEPPKPSIFSDEYPAWVKAHPAIEHQPELVR